VDISEALQAGDISEDDLLKIKLQMLQFQTDVSQAMLARVQGLSDIAAIARYESCPRITMSRVIRLQIAPGNVEDFQAKRCRRAPICARRCKA